MQTCDASQNARRVTLKSRFRAGVGAAAVCEMALLRSAKNSLGNFMMCLEKHGKAVPCGERAPHGLSAIDRA